LLAVALAYQNYAVHASFEHDWQRLPVYVLLLPFLTLVCAGTMTLSAISFRQDSNRRGIAWFVGTAVIFFGVPPVLLLLLYQTKVTLN
jgi:hypothetical protein